MANTPVMINDLRSAQVIGRFCLRMTVLCVFAAIGGAGFARSFAGLLLLSVIFSVAAGAFQRDTPFDPALTHWDEAAAYGLLYGLVMTICQGSAA